MSAVQDAVLKRRMALAKSQQFAERFSLAPNLDMRIGIREEVSILCNRKDIEIIPDLGRLFDSAYEFALAWFGVQVRLPLQLWLASDLWDLRYMTCLACSDGAAFAPGWKNGCAVVICQSPRTSPRNRDLARLGGVFAHEISHFLVRLHSGASDLTDSRRENRELPMWIEEGLCMCAQIDFHGDLKNAYSERLNEIDAWYDIYELWDDLSNCEDVSKAYMQSYREVVFLLKKLGKKGFLELVAGFGGSCDQLPALPQGVPRTTFQ